MDGVVYGMLRTEHGKRDDAQMRYVYFSESVTDETGNRFRIYGIKWRDALGRERCIKDITFVRKQAEYLCSVLNANDIDENEVHDVVADFICELHTKAVKKPLIYQ